MEDIRFRAWDKIGKRMLYTDWDSFRNWYNFETGGQACYERGWQDEKLVLSKPMQFTGLLDKNGKKIYEGDVLEDNEAIPNIDDVGEVIFLLGSFHLKMKMVGKDGFNYFYLENCVNDFEVISNIYENPDLIEDQYEKNQH